MSTTIDNRIVEMRFDNKQFESNVQTSLKTLGELKKGLDLSDSAKGLESISKSASKVSFDGLTSGIETVRAKFSGLDVAVATIFQNVTNSAINAGKKLASSLTEGITAGFSEYETQINAVQTILANTSSKGTTLDQVNAALDELNGYADKTIYNFTEMTRNIGTFTAAGVDLDTSVTAIKGIANLAAVSGSTSQQASTAMYQLSQALAAGKVSLMDWNSVVNAGMGGQVFQDALKETARAKGIEVDSIIEQYGSFRESLTKGEWLTSEVLLDTLATFTGDLSKDQLKSMGYTEEQIEGIVKMGQTANDAATKVKTFTQLFDTLKEATQSGWTQTWEIIVGDFEEAKELLTEVSDIFGGMINESAQARNEMLQGWKDLGGRTVLIEAVRNAFEGIMNIITPIKEAFREIFPPMTSKQLYNITVGLKNLTERFKNSTAESGDLKSTFRGLFAILDIGKQILSALWVVLDPLGEGVVALGGGVLKVTGALGEWIVKLSETTRKTGVFETAIRALITPFRKVRDFLKEVANSTEVKEFFSSVGESVKKLGTGLLENFTVAIELIKEFGSSMKEKLGITSDTANNVGEAIKEFGKGFLSTFAEVIDIIADFVINFLDLNNAICSFWEGGGGVAGIFELMFDKFADIVRLVFDLAEAITGIDLSDMKDSIVTGIQSIRNTVVDFISNIEEKASGIGGTVAATIGVAIENFAGFVESVKEKIHFPGLEIFHDFLVKIKEKIDDVKTSVGDMKTNVVASVDSMGDSIANSKIMQFFTDLWEGIKMIASGIGKAVGGIGEGLSETFTGANFGNVMGSLSVGAITVGLVQLINGIKDVFKELSGVTGNLGGMTENLVGILDSVKGCFEAYQNQLKADTLMKIAGAIALLTAAVVVLAMVDANKLSGAVLAISTLFAELVLSMKLLGGNGVKMTAVSAGCVALATAVAIMGATLAGLGTIDPTNLNSGVTAIAALAAIVVASAKIMSKGEGKLVKGTTGLVMFALAIKILGDVCKDLSTLNTDELIKGLTGVGILLAEVAVFLNIAKFSSKTMGTATGILILSGALKVLASVCEDFGAMSWSEIGKGLTAIGVLLAELALFTKLTGKAKHVMSTATSLVIIGAAMKIFASVVKDMGALSWEEIGKGLVAMGGALAAIVIAVNLMPKDMISKGAGLAAIGGGMVILATVLDKMGGMSWESIAKGMVAMGGALTILTVALHAMKGTLGGSAALLIASSALMVLAPALLLLGSMSWESIGKGLVALAGAFAVLGVAGALLGPLIPTIIGLAGAFTLIGVGVLAIGGGILAASIGLTALTTAFTALAHLGAAGAVAVVKALKTIIIGVADTIVVIGQKLGEAVIAFGQTIINGAPVIAEAVITVVQSVISALVESIPLIVEGVVQILTSTITTIAEYAPDICEGVLSILSTIVTSIAEAMPEILKGVFDILMSVLDTIVEYTPDIVKAVIDIVVGFLEAIAEKLPDVISAAVDVVLAFIEGVTEKLPDIVQAGFDLLISFIQGITDAINNNAPMLAETMKNLFLALLNAALEVLKSGISLIKDAGKKLMDSGLVQGIKDKFNAAKTAVKDLINNAKDAITGKFTEWKNIGKDLIDGFIEGIGEKASDLVDKAKGVVSGALEAAKNLLGINSPSREFRKIGIYSDEGLIEGLKAYSGKVEGAAEDVGGSMLNAMADTISDISDIIDDDDWEPTIRPVIDTSNVEAGMRGIDALFSKTQAMQLNARMSTSGASNDTSTDRTSVLGNTYQFTQNNYSPKALSRIDIYRQTKNQFSAMERMVNA